MTIVNMYDKRDEFYKLRFKLKDFNNMGEANIYLFINDEDYTKNRIDPKQVYEIYGYIKFEAKKKITSFILELFKKDEVEQIEKAFGPEIELIKERVMLPIKNIKSIKTIRDLDEGTGTTLLKDETGLPFKLGLFADKEDKEAIESSKFIRKNKGI